MSELNKPAMPHYGGAGWVGPGITIRQHAAITLRVPMSGDAELDAMIREARRLDMETAAMQSLCADSRRARLYGGTADDAMRCADALLAASAPENSDPEAEQLCLVCGEPTMHIGDKCYVCVQKSHLETKDWIYWHGGECPVPDGTTICVRYRDGEVVDNIPANENTEHQRDASHAFWMHDMKSNDIVAYKVVKGGA